MLAVVHAHEALRRLTDELAGRGESRLPAERVLAERLGTSRTTVRKALELLEQDGTIRRVKGRTGGAYLTTVPIPDDSTHVSQPYCGSRGVLRSLNTVKGIPEILREQGFRDGTSVIRAAMVTPQPQVTRALGLTPEQSAVSLLRLRHADGETLSLEQMYLRPELAAVLRTEMTSMYITLRCRLGVRIDVVDESIEIASLSVTEGALLGQPAGTPVLKLERVGYDQHGHPVEYSVDLFRADRTRLLVRSESRLSDGMEVT
ncbi:GntR family transcriptional regulator [Mycolicibacterium mengxianglii]|uniref:GntR family transcriptional regulator n=1 Tax=Mycolicibacterium mengxianglii TaxID=2736649 RepID=UPI0018D0E555|nr:GntR family transcriptional regulator [Mycolicibacterium mengxianglii]